VSKYGFTDNFDKRYLSGWRHYLLLSGLADIQWVREKLGGRWECWWIGPCSSYIWHPVSIKSSSEENTRPCPVWDHLYFAEEYQIR
jgi:hypothetical protein